MGMTLTVYASIGNSDNKLTQARWSAFHRKFVALVRAHAVQIYGEWASGSSSPWQNACVAFEIATDEARPLQGLLAELAGEYRRDSIAWAQAETTFLTPHSGPPPRTIADDILDHCREHPWDGEKLTPGHLTLNQDLDGTVTIVEAGDVVVIDTDLLACEALANVSFCDGVLTIDVAPHALRYRSLYTYDCGFRVVFRREPAC